MNKNAVPFYETALILYIYIHVVWIGDVIPPVVVYPVFDSVHLRQMIQPPLLECAIVAVAPFGAIDTASTAGEIWKSQPIVTCTVDLRLIAPIVILDAVRREVNETDSRLTGCDLVIEHETLEEIQCLPSGDRCG